MLQTKDSGVPLDLKAVAETGVIEGYASTFGNVDSGGDVVEPGAFVEGLVKAQRSGRKVKMLWQHDQHRPIGIWDDLAEDSKGLWVKGRLFKDSVAQAAEAYALIKEGAVDGLSIGYRTLEAKPKADKPGVRSLIKLDLLEVSPVTFAMNDRAKVTTIKSLVESGGLPSLPEFEEFLREAGFSKTQAAAIAGKGLSHLLRGEPGRQTDADDFFAALGAQFRA